MGGHYNRGARADGAQGALQTRARRRMELIEQNAGLTEVLSSAEIGMARRLAQHATTAIMKQLIVDALSADKASERTQASKLVLAVGWGSALVKAPAPAGGPTPGSVTVNILSAPGQLPSSVPVVDVGAEP